MMGKSAMTAAMRDTTEDRLHLLLEDCDSPQGFHVSD